MNLTTCLIRFAIICLLLIPEACQSPSGAAVNPLERRADRFEPLYQRWHVTQLAHLEPPPNGIAVDSAGDVYFTQQAAHRVRILLPNGKIKTVGKGFLHPYGIAPFNAVTYVADTGNKQVKRVLANGTIQLVGSDWVDPTGVAVDSSGALYVVDAGTGTVTRITQNGKASVVVPESLCGSPMVGVSVKAAGTVYVPCYKSPGEVYRVRLNGSSKALCSGWSRPLTIANDGQGNVFVNDQQIYKCTPAGNLIVIQPDSDIGAVFGIAYYKGALYVTSPRRASIYKLSPPKP